MLLHLVSKTALVVYSVTIFSTNLNFARYKVIHVHVHVHAFVSFGVYKPLPLVIVRVIHLLEIRLATAIGLLAGTGLLAGCGLSRSAMVPFSTLLLTVSFQDSRGCKKNGY